MPVDANGHEDWQVFDGSNSYGPAVPRQEIRHQKLSWLNTFYGNGGARWNFNLAYQSNHRQEFDNVLNPSEAGLDLRLRTLNYTLQYVFPNIGRDWEFSAGLNGMLQENCNQGIEFLVPDYELFDLGGYMIAKKDWNKWTFSGGLRMDLRRLQSDALFLDSSGRRIQGEAANSETLFSAFSRTFSSPSGSVGLSYLFNRKISAKLNFSSGYRAPNIAELSANGVHEGAIRYEYGNRDLKPEHSYQVDLGMQYSSEHISLNVAGFYNFVQQFIFIQKLNGVDGGDSIPQTRNEEGFPAFAYTQHDAHLLGAEMFLDFHPHPLDWLHLENTFSFVEGRTGLSPDSMKYLPLIPQTRWLIGLRVQTRKLNSWIGNGFAKLELDHYFEQNQVYSAYGTETPSSTYSLLNGSVGFDLMHGNRKWAGLILSAQNLTDQAYQNHLSRLRYADVNPMTGRPGIFGMGRNVSIQLEVPLEGKIHR